MIYTYLPERCLQKEIDRMDFEEFLRTYAMAIFARELRIEDLKAGVNEGIASAFGES